ncbi:MAG: hypothetical protein QM740_09840 [Acidovorax sp.]
MPEHGLHQGASLLHSVPETELRFAAVASVPDALGLETLWHLCAHLQDLGYPVVVLDGCTAENDAAPGLMHLLAQNAWASGGVEAPAWQQRAESIAVIPSAYGLRQLASEALINPHGVPPLFHLQQHFRAYAIAVLHGPVEWLGPLLHQHNTTPLILATPGQEGTQQTYVRMKHLNRAGLPSQVCAVVRGRQSPQAQRARQQIARLQECAKEHLGTRPSGLVVDAENPQDLQRLALQLLENAGTIVDAAASLPYTYAPVAPAVQTAQLALSH